jgi:hypothetical protein
MEDKVPRADQSPYTDQEKVLAEGLSVEPELVRSLRVLAERIRETNVSCWANPLVG